MSNARVKLEQEFAGRVGAAGAAAAGFGRAALALALEAAAPGLRPGDEVLLPDFICAQVTDAVRHAGGSPRFFPVRRDLRVEPGAFRAAFTAQTRAAVVAHYFDETLPDIAGLAAICRESGVPLVEDCALALGAGLREDGGPRAGSFGDAAVFSLTKADWCYGGGLAAAGSAEVAARLDAPARERLRPAGRLLLAYGLLRRADFLANRPRHARAAERAGRWLQRWSGLGGGNFFDAGRCDAALAGFSARRARTLLRGLAAAAAARERLRDALTAALLPVPQVLARPEARRDAPGAFFLLQSPAGRAAHWRDAAADQGVTLRLCWPAYQPLEPAQESAELRWLAGHLLILELHPQLTRREIARIARVLRALAESDAALL